MFAFSNANAATIDLGAVSEVGGGRVGDNVVRYVKTFSNSCLEVQVISPSLNWKILAVSNYCGFDGKSFDHDFAEAGFEDVSVKRMVFIRPFALRLFVQLESNGGSA
jgi:hypothetical protein